MKKNLLNQVTTENTSFARGHNFYKAVWIFVIGCLIGCGWEMLLTFLKTGAWVSRSGLLYGPFTPVYGFGALIYMYALDTIESPFKLFFAAAILGGFCEWLCSYLQELIFGTISWDYSHYFLNIGGRTSLFHMMIWGCVGLLFIKVVLPWISLLIEKIPNWLGPTITLMLAGLMAVNIFLSITASYRQTERIQKIPPNNKFEEFLDKTYPDEWMDKIYQNKKNVNKGGNK